MASRLGGRLVARVGRLATASGMPFALERHLPFSASQTFLTRPSLPATTLIRLISSGVVQGESVEGPRVQRKAPDFTGMAVVDGQFKTVKLSDYEGKYLILLFYPLDFTFVCPTEIVAFSDYADKFRALNTEVVAISTDSHFRLVFSLIMWTVGWLLDLLVN